MRPFGRVLDEIEDAAPLYLGMLLHDVGKGHGGGHFERGARMAPRACARLGLDERATEDVVFLVAAHLEMSQVSQHRDLTESSLIAVLRRARGQRPPAEPAARADLRGPPRGGPRDLERVEGRRSCGTSTTGPASAWRATRGTTTPWRRPGPARSRACAPASPRPTSSATSPSSPSATSAPPTPPAWPATSAWPRAGAKRRPPSSGATSPTATARSSPWSPTTGRACWRASPGRSPPTGSTSSRSTSSTGATGSSSTPSASPRCRRIAP